MGTIKKVEQRDGHAPDTDVISEDTAGAPAEEAAPSSPVRKVTDGGRDTARHEQARRVVKGGIIAALVLVVLVALAIVRACSTGSRDMGNNGTAGKSPVQEETSTTERRRHDKNGFANSEKQTITSAGITFQVPSYFKKADSSTEDAISLIAEDGNKTAAILLKATKSGSATADNFYSNSEAIINAYVSNTSNVDIENVSHAEKHEVSGMPGFDFTFTATDAKGVSARCHATIILNEQSEQFAQIMLLQTDNTDYDYVSDFEKIVESAKVAQQQNAQETATTKPEEQKEPATTTEQPQPAPETPAAGVTPSVKEALDSYEAFIDEYIAFMQSYNSSDNQTAMMMDYLSYLSKYGDLAQKIDAMDDDGMTDADLAYYTEVTLRCSQKLLNASL